MSSTIQFKRGNSSNFDSVTLIQGEPAFVVDTGELYVGNGTDKILINSKAGDRVDSADRLTSPRTFTISGDGTSTSVSFDGTQNVTLPLTLSDIVVAGTKPKITYNAKGQVTSGEDLTVDDIPSLTLVKITDAGTAASKNTGIASGEIPVLDTNGKLPNSVLPAVAIVDVFTVSSEVEMLALQAEQGDIAVRNDVRKNFILQQSPANVLSNWVELLIPADLVSSVNGQTGVVTITTITGNAGTATSLETGRTINGVLFDGTENITVVDATREPLISLGTSVQYWSGDKTWQDFSASVRGTILSGLVTNNSADIVDTDTLLIAFGKLQSQISLKAPLDSPDFTGVPTAPTAVKGTNTTQIATTAFVNSQGFLQDGGIIDGGTW